MKFVKRKEYGLASRLKKSAVSYAMMAPYMIVFILLTVIPVIAGNLPFLHLFQYA